MKKISEIVLILLITLMLVSCKPDNNVATVSFVIEDKVYLVDVIKGSKVNMNFVPDTEIETYEFIGWVLEGEIIIIEDLVIEKDLIFIAKYKDLLIDIVFSDKSVVYNGEVQSLAVENLPSDYVVEYENNSNVDAGEYVIVARIFNNGKLLRTRKAVLVIMKKELDISLLSKDIKFDGNKHLIEEVKNLPEDFKITIMNNEGKIYPGIYEVSAMIFGNSNYQYQKLIKTTLKIYYEIRYHKLNEIVKIKNYNTWLEVNDVNTNIEGKVFEGFYLDEDFTVELINNFYLDGHLDIYLKYSDV